MIQCQMMVIQGILKIKYYRKFGAYKPKFHGTTPGYYPFECIDYIYVVLMTLFTWGICLPIWYGLIEAGKIYIY